MMENAARGRSAPTRTRRKPEGTIRLPASSSRLPAAWPEAGSRKLEANSLVAAFLLLQLFGEAVDFLALLLDRVVAVLHLLLELADLRLVRLELLLRRL